MDVNPFTIRKPLTPARPFCTACPKGSGCHCGESPDAQFEWEFSAEDKTRSTIVLPEERKIQFHPSYSVGTAACRGTSPLLPSRHHFWELRMTSPMYGTDVMIGIATKDAKINFYESDFVSVLGIDSNSWGFSYQGYLYHGGGKARIYASSKWSEGSIIGVHLDRWRGTVEFYLNRKPMGIAFSGIHPNLELYPVISSTAAKSSMRLICAQSYRCDLAFECVRALSKTRFSGPKSKLLFSSVLKAETIHAKTKNLLESLPPGLAKFVDNNCWYLFGTRIKSGEFKKDVQLFTDNSAERTWKMLSSDDEAEIAGNEKKSEIKKLKLGTVRQSALATTADVNSDDDDSSSSDDESFAEKDNLVVENKVVFGSTSSSLPASTSTLSPSDEVLETSSNHALKTKDSFSVVEGKSSESGSVKKRFVLKKTK